MEIKIYIDVLLLINMLFNFLLLWLTGFLLHRRIQTLRLLIVAFLGSIYAVCVFFLPPSVLYSFPGKLTVGAIMIAVAFRPHCLKASIKYICVFFTAVFMLGGAAFALFYFTDAGAYLGAVYRNGSLYINLPVYLLLLVTGCCYVILKAVLSVGARIVTTGKQIVTLRVDLYGRTIQLHAFYDSGNLLRDAQNRGVIVAEWQTLQPLFKHATTPEASEYPLTTISYHTLQGKSQIKAFLPDAIYQEEGRRLLPVERMYIGITNETLDFYHNWDAILPHDFEGVEHNHEAHAVKKTVLFFQSSK